jgi:hypothetical protein
MRVVELPLQQGGEHGAAPEALDRSIDLAYQY